MPSDTPPPAIGDDADALVRLKAGDEQLFRDLVVSMTPVMTRLARGYTRSAAAADDAVQDTWVVVIDKLDAFEGRSSMKTWICGILVHTARRRGVRDARTVPFSAWAEGRGPAVDPDRFHAAGSGATPGTWRLPPTPWDEMPEDRLGAAELRAVIDAAIESLPARQRQVITARDVVGLDASETATALGVSSGNQRVLLHRARSRVRAALEEYGADVATAGEPA